jgi:hypothetical protein
MTLHFQSHQSNYVQYNFQTFSFHVIEMDDDKEQQNASSPSDYGDDTSIESLLRRVDEYQEREEREKLNRLMEENAMLRHQVSCYRRSLRATTDLFKEAFEAVLLMQTAIETCNEEESRANRDWLAFWGVHMERPSNLAYRPREWPKWI